MNHIKYFVYKLILISTLTLIMSMADRYINKPFSAKDFMLMGLYLIILLAITSLIDNLSKRLPSIPSAHKVLLLGTALFSGILLVGILIGEITL